MLNRKTQTKGFFFNRWCEKLKRNSKVGTKLVFVKRDYVTPSLLNNHDWFSLLLVVDYSCRWVCILKYNFLKADQKAEVIVSFPSLQLFCDPPDVKLLCSTESKLSVCVCVCVDALMKSDDGLCFGQGLQFPWQCSEDEVEFAVAVRLVDWSSATSPQQPQLKVGLKHLQQVFITLKT